ncbi:hypothetical protein KIPB_000350 [Kipferlia bialata]|uniref:DOMON domain-containing protein n=1 Tax=Kipferlia bialata TaxID=797122 RepID=A0A391NTJ3_9EUKA|nr:hypothetical protein KIPB_000350 [Kipferlia bialata]|eukprot:g350.t1
MGTKLLFSSPLHSMNHILLALLCVCGLCVASSSSSGLGGRLTASSPTHTKDEDITWYTSRSGSVTLGGDSDFMGLICPGMSSVSVAMTVSLMSMYDTGVDYELEIGEAYGINADAHYISDDADILYEFEGDNFRSMEMVFEMQSDSNCIVVGYWSDSGVTLTLDYGAPSSSKGTAFTVVVVVAVLLLLALLTVSYLLHKAKTSKQAPALAPPSAMHFNPIHPAAPQLAPVYVHQ